jgi:multiple sugar transport system substrate-binding protein
MKKIILGAIAGSLMIASSAIAAEVTIRVHYAIPNLWANVQKQIASEFMAENPGIKIELDAPMAENPGIKIELDAPAETYADGVQRILRESVAGNLPDIAYVGLNRWRILEDRGLTVGLDKLIGDPKAFAKMGPRCARLASSRTNNMRLPYRPRPW